MRRFLCTATPGADDPSNQVYMYMHLYSTKYSSWCVYYSCIILYLVYYMSII